MLAVGQAAAEGGGPIGDLEDHVLGPPLNDFLMRYCVNLRAVRTGQVLQKVLPATLQEKGIHIFYPYYRIQYPESTLVSLPLNGLSRRRARLSSGDAASSEGGRKGEKIEVQKRCKALLQSKSGEEEVDGAREKLESYRMIEYIQKRSWMALNSCRLERFLSLY